MKRAGEVGRSTLANGLPLIEMHMPGRLATTVAIAFPGGARQEGPGEVGVAHLLEHLAFKGTEAYPGARSLYRAAEHLGCELGGAASADHVEFSAVVRAESATATVGLLSEVAGRALLAEEHLQVERSVILQEIADDSEDPSERADELLSAAVFAGHRLASGIAGTAHDVARLSHQQVLAFRDRTWSSAGAVAVISGNLDHLDRGRVEEFLSRIPTRPAPAPPPPIPKFSPRVEIEESDGEVVHLRLAFEVPALDYSRAHDRAVADVYSAMLGGSMGSRLFDELREERGLCYWCDGYLWGYEHASFLSIDCSVRPDDLAETRERIDGILNDLRSSGPTSEEALRARAFTAGTVALSFDSTSARASHAVELIMEYDDHDVDPIRHLRAIESVTRHDLAALASQVQPGPCVGCVGPVKSEEFAVADGTETAESS